MDTALTALVWSGAAFVSLLTFQMWWLVVVSLYEYLRSSLRSSGKRQDIYSPDLDRDLLESLDSKSARVIELLESEHSLIEQNIEIAPGVRKSWKEWVDDSFDSMAEYELDLDHRVKDVVGRLDVLEKALDATGERLDAVEDEVRKTEYVVGDPVVTTGMLRTDPAVLAQVVNTDSWYWNGAGWTKDPEGVLYGPDDQEPVTLPDETVTVAVDGPVPTSFPVQVGARAWAEYLKDRDTGRWCGKEFAQRSEPNAPLKGCQEDK